jgi:hypothetical protein
LRKNSSAPFFPAKTPWLLFAGFTLVNGFLSFSPLPPAGKAVLAVLGLALPAVLASRQARGKTRASKPSWREEWLPPPPSWFFPLVILAAAFFRFIHLTSLSLWPLTDEAKSGYFAMQLAAQGPGSARLLYDFSQLPPLYIWMEGLFFKLAGVSLFSLWCFPAVLSLLTVLIFYWAARLWFSKSFAWLFLVLMAFGFWPLYAGRFSHQGSLLLLWECLTFGVAGILAQKAASTAGEKRGRDRVDRSTRYGFYLGLLAGGGFYTFTSWPSVALVLALWVFCFHRRSALPFLGGTALVYLPLGIAWLQNSYGGYIQHVWALNPGEAWWPQLLRGFWDLCAFFWKSAVPPNLFAYKPFWGGYLNPLLGACFFLGVMVFLRQGPAAWIKFWALAFLFFYLPGFLTGGVEMFRVLPILPLLLAGAALGLSSLLSSLKISWRWPVLGLFFLISLGMDSWHLFGVYGSIWTHPTDNWFASKSLDRFRAYSLLDEAQKKQGPGFILCDLTPDLYDQSLSLATFEFNAAEKPGFNRSQAHWAAILTNVHYQAFLEKKFPGAQCTWLTPDMGWPDGGLMLVVITLPCSPPVDFDRLVEADKAMQGMVPLTYDDRDYKSRQPVVDRLKSLHPLFAGDPFLESCFWEKMAENDYGDLNYGAQVEALQEALEKGYPAAHLYNGLGALYFRHGLWKEARQAFEKALQCPVNHTSAAAGLQMLDQAEKTGGLPKD